MRQRDPMWREIEGIERDFLDDISPCLRAHSTMGGDPEDRAITYIARLLEIVRERAP